MKRLPEAQKLSATSKAQRGIPDYMLGMDTPGGPSSSDAGGGVPAATQSQKLLPPGVTYTEAGGTGPEPYGGIAIKQSGDIHVTTGNRPGAYPSHQDLMNGQFGRLQIGERRFGIEGGAGKAMVTKTSGATGFPTLNDLPSIERALSEAGRLEDAIVHVVEGKMVTAFQWTGEGWKKIGTPHPLR
jgi:hypothetical protein